MGAQELAVKADHAVKVEAAAADVPDPVEPVRTASDFWKGVVATTLAALIMFGVNRAVARSDQLTAAQVASQIDVVRLQNQVDELVKGQADTIAAQKEMTQRFGEFQLKLQQVIDWQQIHSPKLKGD